MLKFEWNALRRGDRVVVHGPGRSGMELCPGVVVMLETAKRLHGVGIRISTGEESTIVWPSYLAVHRSPFKRTDACWRCQTLEADKPEDPSR